MACQPCIKKKSGEEGLNRAINLANNFSKISKQDMQVYSYKSSDLDIYDFEPLDVTRENIIEIIRYKEDD